MSTAGRTRVPRSMCRHPCCQAGTRYAARWRITNARGIGWATRLCLFPRWEGVGRAACWPGPACGADGSQGDRWVWAPVEIRRASALPASQALQTPFGVAPRSKTEDRCHCREARSAHATRVDSRTLAGNGAQGPLPVVEDLRPRQLDTGPNRRTPHGCRHRSQRTVLTLGDAPQLGIDGGQAQAAPSDCVEDPPTARTDRER